ncbi:unnamed protein product [Clonostachys byssicola]|uniref:F-box domain-containing protein n=1 Tax=Clonostachys byssicola TaxID=160290 RepID=A0A9N9USP9_9HYPO|nr:unnamed protein product [Clonostachys byssicola]
MATSFEDLSIKLLWTIASFCDFTTLKALSSTSCRYRIFLAKFVPKRVVFSACDIRVSSQLEEFLLADVSLFKNLDPYSTIRSATFFIGPISAADGSGLEQSLPPPPKSEVSILPSQICRSIQVMGSLKSLTLELQRFSPEQGQRFCQSMQTVQPPVLYLRVNGTLPIIESILRHCFQLEALHISRVVRSGNFNNIMAEVKFPRDIQRLAIVLAVDLHTTGVRVPSFRCDLISKITHKFENLTELILHEATYDYEPFDLPHPTGQRLRAAFRVVLRRAIGELRGLRNLKRLAITIWRTVVRSIYPRNSLDRMDRRNDKFYRACISVIGSKMPWLDQVAILTEFPIYWDGHRRDPEGMHIRRKSLDANHDSFPATVTKGY